MVTSTGLSRRNCAGKSRRRARGSTRSNRSPGAFAFVGDHRGLATTCYRVLRARCTLADSASSLRSIKNRAESVPVEAEPPTMLFGKQCDFSFTHRAIARPDTCQFRLVYGAVIRVF